MSILDDLERLERAATAGPLKVHLFPGGKDYLDGAKMDGCLYTGEVEWSGVMLYANTADLELYAATRNALPALLAVARAARDALAMIESIETEYRYSSPEGQDLRAALTALEATP